MLIDIYSTGILMAALRGILHAEDGTGLSLSAAVKEERATPDWRDPRSDRPKDSVAGGRGQGEADQSEISWLGKLLRKAYSV